MGKEIMNIISLIIGIILIMIAIIIFICDDSIDCEGLEIGLAFIIFGVVFIYGGII